MDALMEQVGEIVSGFFESPVVRLAIVGLLAYLCLVWLASAWWTLNDLRRRHRDPMLPFVAAGAVILASPILFPLAVGIYRLVRPRETLAEARQRQLTERLERLEIENALACPGCAQPVEEDWLLCPACRTRLAHRCVSCGRTMGLDWAVCGWCGADFGRTVLPERLLLNPPAPIELRVGELLGARDRAIEPRERALEPGA